MSSLSILGFSENMQYLFTNKGVTRLSLEENDLNGKNMVSYTYDNLNVAVDILKENIQYQYKIGKISLLEYTSHPRKFLYKLMEIFKPNDSITIIKEWEQHFGDKLLILNESTDTLLIEQRINQSWESFKILFEDWYNPADWVGYAKKGVQNVGNFVNTKVKQAGDWANDQKKQIQDKGLGSWVKDKATKVWDSVKNNISKAWNCLTNNFFECLMEGIRSSAFSAVGQGALAGLTMIPGVGQVTNAILFGGLLIWDIYKMMSGKYESGKYQWSILDIVIDCVSLLIPALGKIVKTAGVGLKTVGSLAKAASKGGVLAKAVSVIKGGLTKIIGYIGQAAKWFGEKLGLKGLAKWGSKASQKITKISDELAGGAKVGVPAVKNIGLAKSLIKNKQQLKSIWTTLPKTMPPKTKIITAMKKSFILSSTICAALGIDAIRCKQISNGEQGFTNKESNEIDNALKDVQIQGGL